MNLLITNRTFNNLYFQGFIFLIFLYLLLPNHFISDHYICEEVGNCIDTAWILGLNWVIQKNFIFGSEYVFTYGPLGFLATRNIVEISYLYLLIFDFFLIANQLFILYYAIKKFPNFLTILFSIFILLIISSGHMQVDRFTFTILLISIFWLNYALKYRFVWSLVIPSLLAAILFFIKVNVSLVSMVIFYGYLLYYLFIEKEDRFIKILFGLSIPCLVFFLSFPLNTDLPGYINATISFVDGYNDAMDLGKLRSHIFALISVVIILLCFCLFFIKNFKNNIPLIFSSCIFSFVLFKQSFVRADVHIVAFFSIFPALIGLLMVFFDKQAIFIRLTAVCMCFVCLIIPLSLNIYINPFNKISYLTDFHSTSNSEKYKSNFHRFALPNDIQNVIGQKSIDILPWDIDILYYNKLNYNPRPVVQSYAAYTPYLINLNKEKFEGSSAPEFVIFSNKSFDGRYAFFDDQKVKLNLIKDYYPTSLFKFQGYESSPYYESNAYLLLQRKPNNSSIDISHPNEEVIKLSEDYVLKDINKIYFMKINIDYSWLGKAIRFAYKPFWITINFTLEDGSTYKHRAVIPILKEGVIINPYLENEKDFLNFVTGNRLEEKRIRSFSFELRDEPTTFARTEMFLKYLGKKSYKEDIKLSVSEVTISKNY